MGSTTWQELRSAETAAEEALKAFASAVKTGGRTWQATVLAAAAAADSLFIRDQRASCQHSCAHVTLGRTCQRSKGCQGGIGLLLIS